MQRHFSMGHHCMDIWDAGPPISTSLLPCGSWLQDLAVMFVDGRVVHGRWDDEDEDSDEEDPYTPPAFMQLLDSIAKSCPVSAAVQ